jgi:hypothetical protein
MGKLKQTKLKHRKHKDSDENSENSENSLKHVNHDTHKTHEIHKKYKILTSKNKNKLVLKEGRYYRKNDSINKKHKRSQKHFNIRTLDALKKYGVTLKNQNGGFIISYLKFKWNMRKIKKIIEKLGKNKVEMNEFIHSYEKQPETFKRLGDKKAVVIYDILRTIKDKTIIQFLLDNKEEKTYDTSNMEHDLNNIKTKIEITTANQLKQYNKEIEKEKPKLAKNLAKFRKDSEKFRKINEEYSKIMAFYEEQRELSDRYNSIKDLEKLTSDDKSIKTKYLKNEENIKYILSYKQEDINELNNSLKKIATLMNMADDYDAKFKDLTEGKYETDLQKWQANYKDIYVNITDIEGGIKNVSDTLEKIKEYADQIGSNLSSIYAAIKQSFKLDPILKVKRIIDENLGYLKNIKEVSLKKVKYAFIEQIPIEQIEFYLPLASAALIQTEKSMNELNASFILDSSFIRTGHAGGWRDTRDMRGMGIGELEWFGKGGVKIFDYNELLKINIDTFLDTDYRDIIATLENINTDLNEADQASDIFKIPNIDFLNIMKIYFNIHLFCLYYLKSRTDLNPSNNTTPLGMTDNIYNTNISTLLSIIIKYEYIIKDYKDVEFKDLPTTIKDEITKYIRGINPAFTNSINVNIRDNYFNQITAAEKNIWNPFKENDKLTLKNLYYEYNPYSALTNDSDLTCIQSFIGYYNKKHPDIITYNDKDKCEFTKKNLFDIKSLHYKYDDIPILYKDVTDGIYKFITIYYNDNIRKYPNIKIKQNDKSDEITDKFDKFIVFLAAPSQLDINITNKKNKDILISEIYEATKNINDEYDKLFCNNETNDKFEDIINDYLKSINNKICNDTENSNHWSISYMKKIIIEDWSYPFLIDDYHNIQTITTVTTPKIVSIFDPNIAAGNGPGPINTNHKTFNVFYGNEKIWFNKTITPLILRNIYNNINHDKDVENYSDDRNTVSLFINKTDPDTTLLNILQSTDKKITYYVMLYKYKDTIDDIKAEIQDPNNINMLKYLFIWLKSSCNSEADKELQTDNISDFIYNLYETTSKSKSLLSNLDVSNIETNEFYKAFKKEDKKIFKDVYVNLLNGVKGYLTTKPIVLKEDKEINTLSKPILPRAENRLVFDLPQSQIFNENTPYTNPNFAKKIQSEIITKSYNKTGDYKNVSLQYVKRIVSFNVNNWNRSINDVKDIYPNPDPLPILLSDPLNAISFIKKYLPETDVLGLLDYSLYPNEFTANKHIEVKLPKPIKIEGIINVDNKYTQDFIKTELKLDNFFIKNDNFDNVIKIPNLNKDDNMFLGKALYYNNNKPTVKNAITIKNQVVTGAPPGTLPDPDTILYSEITIHNKPIGLYLVNFYNEINDPKLTMVLSEIETNINTTNINEIVIMGNFHIKMPYKIEDLIKSMGDDGYIQFGSKIQPDTCIDTEYRDLCFVSKAFLKKFTILNQNNIVVPSGSVSSHYPIYLDIIENEDKEINESNVRTIEKDGTVIIQIPSEKLTFILKPKVKKTTSSMPGGGSKSIDLTSDYVLEKLTKDGVTFIDVSKDPTFKDYKIEIEDKKIIKFINVEGNLKYSINEEGILTTFKNDGKTIELITMRDPKNDKVFINKNADGKVVSVSEISDDGKVTTKDISTGEVVKSYYEEEDDDLEKAKHEGKRLLSTFMDDVKKENLTMVVKNRDSILSYIKKINDLIQTRLKPKNYEAIKLKLDALAKNIIELKAIEPKLTPDKVLIKEYAQKARSYDWMEDVTKREKTSLSLQDEAKELEAIIKTHPEIKDILPSSGERLTKENILEIIGSLDLRKNQIINKTFLEKFQNKLKQPESAKILLNYLDETYPTKEQYLTKCVVLFSVNTYAPSKIYGDKMILLDCNNVFNSAIKEKFEKQKK